MPFENRSVNGGLVANANEKQRLTPANELIQWKWITKIQREKVAEKYLVEIPCRKYSVIGFAIESQTEFSVGCEIYFLLNCN